MNPPTESKPVLAIIVRQDLESSSWSEVVWYDSDDTGEWMSYEGDTFDRGTGDHVVQWVYVDEIWNSLICPKSKLAIADVDADANEESNEEGEALNEWEPNVVQQIKELINPPVRGA